MNSAIFEQIDLLKSTPRMLTSWLSHLPPSLLIQTENPKAWNTIDIIKHLIFNEETDWIPRLLLMVDGLQRNTIPTFEPFDRLGHLNNPENRINNLLDDFHSARENSLYQLNQILSKNKLEALKGIHPALGPVNGLELISAWAVHDQSHIYQIARNFTSGFVDNIGPWGEYLKIVNQNFHPNSD